MILEGNDPAFAASTVAQIRSDLFTDPEKVLEQIKSDRAKRRLNLRGDLAERWGEQ